MSPHTEFHLERARVQRELAASTNHFGSRQEHLNIAAYHEAAASAPEGAADRASNNQGHTQCREGEKH